jgi:hypothetical protein
MAPARYPAMAVPSRAKPGVIPVRQSVLTPNGRRNRTMPMASVSGRALLPVPYRSFIA